MNRRQAREFVLHLIFSGDYLGTKGQQLLDERLSEQSFSSLSEEYELYNEMPAKSQLKYINAAVKGVLEHGPELDSYIEKYSAGWSVGRISNISKCIIRLCMYETLYMQIPVGASVNEALELAKKYDSPEAASFVNGIIGAFTKKEISDGTKA